MAYRFTARAMPGVFDASLREKSYEVVDGSPPSFNWLTDIEKLPDLIKIGDLCVSSRLHDLIDYFEPGVHTFTPAVFRMKNGLTEERFFLKVGQKFDAVSGDHSNWNNPDGALWKAPPSREKRLVFDARLIGKAHLWHNAALGSEMNPMASNALCEAAQDAGLTGLLLDHFDETDLEGHYTVRPFSQDRVYSLGHGTRLRPSGHIPLTVKVKLLDGQKGEIRFSDDPDCAPMTLSTAIRSGRFLDPANVPTRAYYYQNAKGTAPDIYSYSDLPLTVSSRFKNLIERFEPDLHQFLPMDFIDKKGNVLEHRHIMIVGTILDARSREHSTMLGEHTPYNPGSEQGSVVFDRAIVNGYHIWRDRFGTGHMIISNDVAKIIEKENWPDLVFSGYELTKD